MQHRKGVLRAGELVSEWGHPMLMCKRRPKPVDVLHCQAPSDPVLNSVHALFSPLELLACGAATSSGRPSISICSARPRGLLRIQWILLIIFLIALTISDVA